MTHSWRLNGRRVYVFRRPALGERWLGFLRLLFAESASAQWGHCCWRKHADNLVERGVVQSGGLLQGCLMFKPVLRCQHRETNQQQDAEKAHGWAETAIGLKF